MKYILYTTIISNFLFSVNFAEAKTIRVKTYYKPSIGKYVITHYKTSANKTKLDNFSTKNNYNPYTGKKGYVNPYKY